MVRLGDFLGRQGRFLLGNDHLALVYIAVLAVIPFGAWLSAAIIALITLRKGWSIGAHGLAVAMLVLLSLSLITMPLSAATVTAIMAFLPCYLAAGILHSTASWKLTGFFIVLQALFVIMLIHWVDPAFVTDQYHYVQTIINELKQETSDASIAAMLNDEKLGNGVVIANYLLGIQSVSVALSTIVSLLLARSVQSRLFYPEGFRQEMIGFRANGFGVILLIIALAGAYQHSPVAISCLPILATYYGLAGLSLSFNILAKGKGIGTFILLLVPLILLPFVMLPIYVVLGALDSLFNFRLRLLSNADKKEKKG